MVRAGQKGHIERVVSVVSGVGRTAAETPPDDAIRRSWLRCTNRHGLDPSRPRTAQILTDYQLRDHQERIDEFLRVARSGTEQLYKQVAPLGYVLLLSDSEGVTVDCIATPGMEKDLKAAGVYMGAYWKEDHAGTNGIGTAIAERTPLICHQEDHFDATHITLSCVAAPIFDPRGDLLAVLNITAMMSPREKASQYLTLQLTTMHAKAIEDANFVRRFDDHGILRLGRAWPFAELSGELMLAFDDDGIITGANTSARRELVSGERSGDWLIGHHLTDVFDCTMEDIWKAARGVGIDSSVMTADSQNLFYMSVRQARGKKGRQVSQSVHAPAAISAPESYAALDVLAGADAAMRRTLDQAKRLVNRKVNILIHGETGSGKELFAQALHKSSVRAAQPFVALNCAAIPESLIESELFGYVAGAFTGGRTKGMKGLILQSDGGTLFLDEIGDMPLQLQTRLLRVLSEHEVMPIGGDKPVHVDLTVIAASHRDLRTMIAEGRFREDLYYRLCGATLYLPPLRERNDLPFIVEGLLQQESENLGTSASISSEALDALWQYSWPGNIRELRNVLRCALAFSDVGVIRLQDLPKDVMGSASKGSARVADSRLSRDAIKSPAAVSDEDAGNRLRQLLRKHEWNITAVAAELQVSRVTVYRRMRRHGVVTPNKSDLER